MTDAAARRASDAPPGSRGLARTLSDRDLARLAAAVRAAAGIHLGPEKRDMIEARLGKLARRTSRTIPVILDEAEDDPDGSAMAHLLDVLTTSYTAFFREAPHFEWLARRWLPRALRERRPLRIWCAAAATGEEPCSIAITLHEEAERLGVAPPPTLLATDISRRALAVAADGVYPAGHVAALEAARVHRWFQRGVGAREGWVRVRRELAATIAYRRHNLLDPPPARELDLVFLRNTLIYFDDRVQAEILQRIRTALAPGGVLVIGHAENVRRHAHGYLLAEGHTILERAR